MYSLVNIATLVRDVARRPSADAIAVELLRALALTDAQLATLDCIGDQTRYAAVRAHVLAADRAQPRAMSVLAAARDVASDVGLRGWTAASEVLEQATLFGADELHRFVRDEVLGDAWERAGDVAVCRYPRAIDIVCDGVSGAWCGDARLGEVWRAWVALQSPPLAPAASEHVVEAVHALTSDAAFAPVPAEWSAHMHDACWALHLTGRLRDATIVQLHALRALLAVHAPLSPPPRAVATVIAAVHATMAADVLDDDTLHAMTQPLFRLVP